jgi:hypothetical protein
VPASDRIEYYRGICASGEGILVTRAKWRRIADERVHDTTALLSSRRWSAAYYLAGYAMERGRGHGHRERGATMDQEPLVIEQIEAGRKFLEEFDKHIPVRAAFWLKVNEDSGWYLHIASDQISDKNVNLVYREVGKVGKTIDDPNFDLFQVKLIGVYNPFARAALDLYKRCKARVPTHIRGRSFGGMSIEGVYVYPPRVAAVSN